MEKAQKTVSKKFAEVIETLKIAGASQEQIEFIEQKKAQHEKSLNRNSSKPSKAAKENKPLIAKIDEWFFAEADPDIAYTSQEIQEAVGFENLTPQKMTALLRKAENAGRVDKATNDKKKVGYQAK